MIKQEQTLRNRTKQANRRKRAQEKAQETESHSSRCSGVHKSANLETIMYSIDLLHSGVRGPPPVGRGSLSSEGRALMETPNFGLSAWTRFLFKQGKVFRSWLLTLNALFFYLMVLVWIDGAFLLLVWILLTILLFHELWSNGMSPLSAPPSGFGSLEVQGYRSTGVITLLFFGMRPHLLSS